VRRNAGAPVINSKAARSINQPLITIARSSAALCAIPLAFCSHFAPRSRPIAFSNEVKTGLRLDDASEPNL
jgi:hypothetical protein